MGKILFILRQKPSAWHRFWVRAVLGWVWEDYTPPAAFAAIPRLEQQ